MDNLFRFLGLGAAVVGREELPRAAPRALDVDQQRLLLQAAEESTARDRAIVALLLFTGLRLSEAAALHVADVRISARKRLVVGRSGKGDVYREVELNALVRAMLDERVDAREKVAQAGETSFFVSRTGSALSSRSIDLALRRVAARARLEPSAHVLRHTFVTGLVRAGNDLVLVAELARTHPRLTMNCDAAAATELRGIAGGNHVCVVLGHRDPGFSHGHRISRESLSRVQRAEWVAQRKPTRAAVLTGYTSTGGLSEAEQMRAGLAPSRRSLGARGRRAQHRRQRGNAPCRSSSRSAASAMSLWSHRRGTFAHRTCSHPGVATGCVHFAVDWRGDWPRMLARELQEARAASRERREALAAMALPAASG